jgi:hypothetical protein
MAVNQILTIVKERFPARAPWRTAMIAVATFDSETLDLLLRAAIDDVWQNLPPDRRTTQNKERMAGAAMRLANKGVRDPARLAATTLAAAFSRPSDMCDIEARGDEAISSPGHSMGRHRRTESEIGRSADLYRDRCGAPVPISLMRPTRDDRTRARAAGKGSVFTLCGKVP